MWTQINNLDHSQSQIIASLLYRLIYTIHRSLLRSSNKLKLFISASGAASPLVHYTTSTADSTVEDDGEEEEDEDYEGNDVDDNDEYYDEEDEDEVYELLFETPVTLSTRAEETSHWATIGSGDLQIVYDRDLLVSRILMKSNDGLQLFNSIISGDSRLTVIIYLFNTIVQTVEVFNLKLMFCLNFGHWLLIYVFWCFSPFLEFK